MSKTIELLYQFFQENITLTPEERVRLDAISIARTAVQEELKRAEGERRTALLDIMDTLDGQAGELHSRALFTAALTAGMELGRLSQPLAFSQSALS